MVILAKILAAFGMLLMAAPILLTGHNLVRIVVLLSDANVTSDPQIVEDARAIALKLDKRKKCIGLAFFVGLGLALTGIVISPA
ncbi:MAG: hypothetical protein LAT81_15000 [Oceanicaulis sp.]|nr:hypothetical protein [Oceanicaulis sp.]